MIKPNPLSLLNHFTMPISVFKVDPKCRREKYPHSHYEGLDRIKPALLPKDTLSAGQTGSPLLFEWRVPAENFPIAPSTTEDVITSFSKLSSHLATPVGVGMR